LRQHLRIGSQRCLNDGKSAPYHDRSGSNLNVLAKLGSGFPELVEALISLAVYQYQKGIFRVPEGSDEAQQICGFIMGKDDVAYSSQSQLRRNELFELASAFRFGAALLNSSVCIKVSNHGLAAHSYR
jgi:hypothetical protein